ncbi:MAG: hypothetical protein Q4E46_02675 [Candidatus Saccharibacteria bacterium]|nr:hypothetical protein [Candidatus Saccharibacteria bacterium]
MRSRGKNVFRRIGYAVRGYFESRMECIRHHGHYRRNEAYNDILRRETPQEVYIHCRSAMRYLRTHEYWPGYYDQYSFRRFCLIMVLSVLAGLVGFTLLFTLLDPFDYPVLRERIFLGFFLAIVATGIVYEVYHLHRKYINYRIEIDEATVEFYNNSYPGLLRMIAHHRESGVFDPPERLEQNGLDYACRRATLGFDAEDESLFYDYNAEDDDEDEDYYYDDEDDEGIVEDSFAIEEDNSPVGEHDSVLLQVMHERDVEEETTSEEVASEETISDDASEEITPEETVSNDVSEEIVTESDPNQDVGLYIELD